MNAIGAIVLFVLVPVLIMLVIVSAVLGPKWSRAGRWRPGETWHEEPVWLGPGAADDGQVALPSAADGDAAVAQLAAADAGGADVAVADAAADGDAAGAQVAATAAVATTWEPGGARGRW
jgi:hypothetical protein